MSSETEIQRKEGYHHGDLRAQLVEATRRLVEEKGPEQFSVSEACRVAGVSTAAPYRHFKDKDEMLAAVMMAGMERKFAMMRAAVAECPEGELERIVQLGRVYIRFATTEPGVFRLVFGLAHDHAKREELMEEAPRHYALVENEVALYLGRDEVDEDVKTRAFMLWTFVHGLSFLLIDEKVDVIDMPIDVEGLLWEIARRVMIDR
ncbi:TetR/AcrR family transcriptional regulator [Pontivivens ytuae]|nr:TetR/AcrR family transcriptional regulator [Pontivivens ytuae]